MADFPRIAHFHQDCLSLPLLDWLRIRFVKRIKGISLAPQCESIAVSAIKTSELEAHNVSHDKLLSI